MLDSKTIVIFLCLFVFIFALGALAMFQETPAMDARQSHYGNMAPRNELEPSPFLPKGGVSCISSFCHIYPLKLTNV